MDIIEVLRDRLRREGRARWREIAAQAGVSPKLPEKIVYGLRQNPRVQTIQPLLDYFAAQDKLPDAAPPARHAA